MPDKQFSRRNFFRKLAAAPTEKPDDNGDDPLFKKYSRKKLTPRRFNSELAQLKVGSEDKEADATVRIGNVTSGLTPYTGTWSEWEVLHLLRRTNFGWKKPWVDALLKLSPSAAVDAVLAIGTTAPAPPVNWYQKFFADESAIAGNSDATNKAVGFNEDWTPHYFPNTAASSNAGQTTNHYRMDSLRRWLFGLTLTGEPTIREKMVWFWYHLIPIDFETIYQSSNANISTNCARLFYRYVKLFRDNALGDFKALIRAVAVEPSMMYYLNNQANSATAPDENFARELMELFTLGKDDPSNTYTQADVVEAAKVLTGWRVQNINTATLATNFVPGSHKTGNKTFSSFFGGTVIPSTAANAGAKELDELIDMIFTKKVEVSRYICRRLYRFFVYYVIDAIIVANVITPLAQTFVASNWNIKPVLEQLFKSEHFFDVANRGAYIKSPFDLVAGTLNSFGVNTTDANIENQYRIWSKYNDGYCLSMEQQMGSIPNVSGWNAFYQTPAYHQYWINSNSIQKRFVFLRDIVSNYHTVSASSGSILDPATNATRRFFADTLAFAQQFGATTAADPTALVAASIRYLLPVDLSTAQKSSIKTATLLDKQSADHYWSDAWTDWQNASTAYNANPTAANLTTLTQKKNIVETRLKNLYTTLCQLAEYQLM